MIWSNSRYSFVVRLAAIFMGLSWLLRLGFVARAWASIEGNWAGIGHSLLIGFGFDLVSLAYLVLPFALYLSVMPSDLLKSRWQRHVHQALFFVLIFFFLFEAVAEWTFWEEFNTRFNFIAVDYLVYTHEVLQNVLESYPVKTILVVIGGLALLTSWWVGRGIDYSHLELDQPRRRWLALTILPAVVAFDQLMITNSMAEFSPDVAYLNEIAKSGPYSFLSAVKNNQIDYLRFYKQDDPDQVNKRLRELLRSSDKEQYVEENSRSVERQIEAAGPERQLNVILVAVESLSAKYLGAYGSQSGLTPNLDALAEKSLVATNLFATGTRTVRGLEALSLSLPPTPGNSIVRRPNKDHLFNLGTLFQVRGYQTKFIYGGYGYFDNMNAFFRANGFSIVDRDDFAASEIEFANAWGVSDEDLFRRVVREADASYAAKKKFFSFALTTSNHRPYTYPQKIDLPSGEGREGAVKYTDYALGRLIEMASERPWFEDTVFVIVADHCAAVAGKTALPVEDFHIPMLIYAPKWIAPQKLDHLMSQIDVAPTLAGILNFTYRSKFFGQDAIRHDPARALIGTYQKLGLYQNGLLAVLSPVGRTEIFSVQNGSLEQKLEPDMSLLPGASEILTDAVSYYQGASQVYSLGLQRQQ